MQVKAEETYSYTGVFSVDLDNQFDVMIGAVVAERKGSRNLIFQEKKMITAYGKTFWEIKY